MAVATRSGALLLLFFGLLFFGLLGLAAARAQAPERGPPRDLRVVYTEFPPYTYTEDGAPTGYAVALIQEIAEREGWRLSYLPAGSPAAALDMLREGRADLHPSLGATDERREIVDFTRSFDSWRIMAFVDPGRRKIVRLDEAAGLRFGYVRGSVVAHSLPPKPSFTPVEVGSTEELIADFLSGELDGVVFVESAWRRIARISGFSERVGRLLPTLRDAPFAMGVSKTAPGLRVALDAALDRLQTSPRWAEIRSEWFAPEPYWTAGRVWMVVGGLGGALLLAFAFFAAREARIRRERDRMALIGGVFQSSPFGLTLFDQEDRLRLFNGAYCDLFPKTRSMIRTGVSGAELLRIRAAAGEFDLGGQDPESWLEESLAARRSGDVTREYAFTDGRVVRITKRRSVDGMTLGVYEDVTAARAQDRAVEALGRRLRRVLDTAANGIIAFDRDGAVVLINPAGRHYLGLPSQETPFAWPKEIAFLDAETLQPLEASKDPVRRALAGQRLTGENNLMTRHAKAELRYVRISSALMEGDESIRAVVVVEDVTAEEINRRAAERRTRLDALGQLTGGVAHDFNNLLGAILASVQVAQMDSHSDRAERMLQNAIQAVRRGSALAGRMLSFAKQTPGQAASRPVKDLFRSAYALTRPAIEEAISIVFEAPEEPLEVYCDQAQLDNALLNLILNARDAIERAGKGDSIRISARTVESVDSGGRPTRRAGVLSYETAEKSALDREDARRDDGKRHRYVEIAVSDNGPGMSEAVKVRAVEPFFTTKSAGSGTGLGLSMVYGFVQQAGGELRIYSEEGLGATVRMLLPRGVRDGAREAAQPGPAVARGRGERILVVEDEASLLASLMDGLEVLGYAPKQASSGVEALRMLEQGLEVDAILTDIVMPGGVGGFELANRVRAMRPRFPVVYMSGYTGFSKEEMGAAVAPLVPKPCSLPELSQALRAALEGGEIAAAP